MLIGILIGTVVHLGFWMIVAAFCDRPATYARVAAIFVGIGFVIRVYQWPVVAADLIVYLMVNAFWAGLAWLIVSRFGRRTTP